MWKFILLAMFYGQDGEILHEFRAPVILNTEAACREMVVKNSFQKTEVEKNGRKYLVEAKADCIYDPPVDARSPPSSDVKAEPEDAAREATSTIPAAPAKEAKVPEPQSRPSGAKRRGGPLPRTRDARAPARPPARRFEGAMAQTRTNAARTTRAGGFFDVWPGDVAGPEYDVPGLSRRR